MVFDATATKRLRWIATKEKCMFVVCLDEYLWFPWMASRTASKTASSAYAVRRVGGVFWEHNACSWWCLFRALGCLLLFVRIMVKMVQDEPDLC